MHGLRSHSDQLASHFFPLASGRPLSLSVLQFPHLQVGFIMVFLKWGSHLTDKKAKATPGLWCVGAAPGPWPWPSGVDKGSGRGLVLL